MCFLPYVQALQEFMCIYIHTHIYTQTETVRPASKKSISTTCQDSRHCTHIQYSHKYPHKYTHIRTYSRSHAHRDNSSRHHSHIQYTHAHAHKYFDKYTDIQTYSQSYAHRHDSSGDSDDDAAERAKASYNSKNHAPNFTMLPPFTTHTFTTQQPTISAVPPHVSRRAKGFGRLALTVAMPRRDPDTMMMYDMHDNQPHVGTAALSLARTRPAAFWKMRAQKMAATHK